MKGEVLFGRTPLGQLIYDIGFAKLSDRYLARKHHLPIAKIRSYREAWKRGTAQAKGKRRKK